ncbi:flavin reductase family protein [Streptomyces sp. NPDC055210]
MPGSDAVTVRTGAGPVDLRPLMASFPTGVAIVTAREGAARPWGMTCTSLCSVSLRPAILLVCLRTGSPTLAAALGSGAFAVNLLRHDARPTAELFASGEPDRFARTDWSEPRACAGPHLHTAAHAVADCTVTRSETIGDHDAVFGEVVAITQRSTPAPLLYGLHEYRTWSQEGHRT